MERKEVPQREIAKVSSPPDDLFKKHGMLILLVLITVVSAVVYKDFIFSEKLFLFKDIGTDTVTGFYPQYYHIADYLRKEGLPKWSFHQGMGQNIFPGWFQDPFVGLLYIAGKDSIAYSLVYMEILKIFCAGIFFFLFLKKMSGSDFAALAGALCYAFSGIVILGGSWFIFSTAAVYGALLLYSFEKFYQDGDWRLLPVSMALLATFSAFTAYLLCLFLAIYIPFRYFEEPGRNFKGFALLLSKTVGLLLLGTAVSAFFLLGSLKQMIDSPRVSGDASYFSSLMATPVFGLERARHYATAILRFFSSDMSGTGSNFGGWRNYLEAPIFYCGLITLLLLPQAFSGLRFRRALVLAVLPTIFIMPVVFPFFRYAVWLFSGNYYREFSLFLVFSLLFLNARVLKRLSAGGKLSFPILGGSLAGLLILLYLPYPERMMNAQIKHAAAAFLVFHAVALTLFGTRRFRTAASIMLLALISTEAAFMSFTTVGTRPVVTRAEQKSKWGIIDYTHEAMDYLHGIDNEFFRIEKYNTPYFYGLNDATVQGFFGTRSYHSFNQLNYIRFLDKMGIIQGDTESQTRWVEGLYANPALHSFASVKYALYHESVPSPTIQHYQPFKKIENVQILKNRNSLPFGYTYDKWISLNEFESLSDDVKKQVLYKAAAIDPFTQKISAGFPKFSAIGVEPFSYSEFSEDVAQRASESLRISALSQNLIRGSINISGKKLLFFTIPFDKGWSAYVNGAKVDLIMVNVGFTGFFIDRGEHIIELKYKPPLLDAGAIASSLALLVYLGMLIGKKRHRKD